jgi:hypothetical protein
MFEEKMTGIKVIADNGTVSLKLTPHCLWITINYQVPKSSKKLDPNLIVNRELLFPLHSLPDPQKHIRELTELIMKTKCRKPVIEELNTISKDSSIQKECTNIIKKRKKSQPSSQEVIYPLQSEESKTYACQYHEKKKKKCDDDCPRRRTYNEFVLDKEPTNSKSLSTYEQI